MIVEKQQVTLRKLVASEGKVIVSKALDEETGKPTLIKKIIYLAVGANEDDYEEVDENLYKEEE